MEDFIDFVGGPPPGMIFLYSFVPHAEKKRSQND